MLQTDLARASLVKFRVLRTSIGSIAKSLHKLSSALRFYFFFQKTPNSRCIKVFQSKTEKLLVLTKFFSYYMKYDRGIKCF